MPIKNRLILAGVFRSGTTFLARALNSHPLINLASDPFFEFFKIARNIWFRNKFTAYDDRQPLEDYFLKGEDYFKPFHENFTGIKFDKEDIEELKKQIPRNAELFSPAVIPFLDRLHPGPLFDVFDQLIEIVELAYPKDKSEVVGIKEVWIDEFAEPMIRSGCKFVHIIRDPRAIIASNKVSSTGAYPILFLIRQWRKSVSFATRNKGKKNFLLVQYEDLVSNPEMKLKEITDFVGVPYHENISNANNYKDGSGKQWKQNSSYKVSAGINTKSIEKWRQVLDEGEIAIIEGLCIREMNSLQYGRETEDFPLRQMLDYQLPAESIAEWIKKYNYEFNEKRIFEEYLLYAELAGMNPIEFDSSIKKKLFLNHTL